LISILKVNKFRRFAKNDQYIYRGDYLSIGIFYVPGENDFFEKKAV